MSSGGKKATLDSSRDGCTPQKEGGEPRGAESFSA